MGNFFDWLENRSATLDGDPSASASAFALLLIIGLIALAFTAIWPNAGLPSDEQSAPSLSPHEKRLASKAAYRARRSADPAFRESERERVSEWRRNNPEKARAQKARRARPTIIALRRHRHRRPELSGRRHCLRWRPPSATRHLSVGRSCGRRPAALLADGGRDARAR